MNWKTQLLGAAALAVVAADPAAAGQYYFGIEGGVSIIDDLPAFRSHTAIVSGSSDVTINFDPGWALLATVGYSFEQARLEGEIGWRSNKLAIPTSSRTGDLDELSLMLNLAFDFPVSERFKLTLGAGAGADKVMFKDGYVDDHDWQFAYQAIAGARFALTKRVDLALTYRYLRVSASSYKGTHYDSTNSTSHVDLYTLDDIDKHTFTLGFVFGLGGGEAPPPIVTPPPPVQPPQNFTIYFDKKCNLTADANTVLSEAGSVALQTGSATIRLESADGRVADETTTSCRVRAVTMNLVAKGLPEASIRQSGPNEIRIQTK